MQEEDGIFSTLIKQVFARILHQQGMTIVNGISQLECKNSISL
jgi:hypothetical protein